MEELLKELQAELEAELASDSSNESDEVLLSSKIKGAYRAVRFRRNYQEHHTEEYIDKDMCKMYSTIKDLATYDWNHIGGEGEVSHSENGISRSWEPRNNILAEVVPFGRVL